jgi:thiamine biosynthesis lipoprotein
MKRPLIALLFLLVATIALPRIFDSEDKNSAGNSLAPVTLSGRTMGTAYHISLIPAADTEHGIEEVHKRIEARLEQINQRMSTYIDDSELNQVNNAGADTWVDVSAETASVIDTALKISTQTNGAFDITVGNLVNLWGFGPDINLYAVPEENRIREALSKSGYQNLKVRLDPPQIQKSIAGLYLDLSGIAKGYGVDQIAELLIALGYPNHLVEIGGEIRTGGEKAPGQPWSIGIERPQSKGRSVIRVVHTSSTTAMATSGDYRNYFEHQGRRYSHTIDPTTGYPITHRLAAVSVLHDSCMLADAYATALMVMGPERAMEFATKHNLAIYMLVKKDHGFVSLSSPEFEKYISSTQVK